MPLLRIDHPLATALLILAVAAALWLGWVQLVARGRRRSTRAAPHDIGAKPHKPAAAQAAAVSGPPLAAAARAPRPVAPPAAAKPLASSSTARLFELHAQLSAVIKAMQPEARRRGLQLTLATDGEQHQLLGDPQRIGHILQALVDNALRYTAHGRVQVLARAVALGGSAPACDLTISVSDSGSGIPAARLARLMSAPADASASGGLARCSRWCAELGGSLSARSQPGQGSVFTVQLRCKLLPATSLYADTAPMDADELEALRGKRVLVVDDNAINRQVLQRQLTRLGMDVETANDGRAAVQAALARPFDLVLMDVSMPLMDGHAATRAIRASGGGLGNSDPLALASLPIIGVTAQAMPGDREACEASGMTGYLTKPVQRQALITAIQAAIGDIPGSLTGRSPG
ncbi:MAG: response regulator [Aquabacterium sp.]|nr:response regulator [Aquabacterium sp.]